MLRALAKNGGVVQVNFFSGFLDEDYRKAIEAQAKDQAAAIQKYVDSLKAEGKPVNYIDIPPQAYKDALMQWGTPEWAADDLVALAVWYTSGGAAYTTTTIADITKTAPITLSQFVHDHAAAFKAAVPA